MLHRSLFFHFLFVAFSSLALESQPYRNLVLEGGGIRGIAHVGAISVLDSTGVLKEIENVAGTSAGAIQAMTIAVGYTSAEILSIMENTKWEHFNDGGLVFLGGGARLIKYYGYFQGQALREWIDEMLFKKTGFHNLSFFQLDSLKKTNSQIKNLFVVVSNLTLQEPMELSVRTMPGMLIADAVAASAAIPYYYEPVIIDRQGKRLTRTSVDSNSYFLVDGGMLANYPYFLFDSFRGPTLGIMLDRPDRINRSSTGSAPFSILNIYDFSEACYNSVLEMQTRRIWNADMEKNTIRISVGNIGPRIRKMKKEEVELLVNNGKIATLQFLAKGPIK